VQAFKVIEGVESIGVVHLPGGVRLRSSREQRTAAGTLEGMIDVGSAQARVMDLPCCCPQ